MHIVGYEPNGLNLWNVELKKFMTARYVVVETNVSNSRTVSCTKPLEDSMLQFESDDQAEGCIWKMRMKNEQKKVSFSIGIGK